MEVETYETTEILGDGNKEVPEEQIRIMRQLGLNGQLGNCDPEETEVNPYRQMLQEEWDVYCNVCPQVTPVEDYKGDTIPLRVLQVLSHCKQSNLFKYYYVMAKQTAVIKDPVLIGCNDSYWGGTTWKYRMPENTFILARWGEELESFELLKKKATDICKSEFLATAKESIAKVKSMIEGVKEGFIQPMGIELEKFRTISEIERR